MKYQFLLFSGVVSILVSCKANYTGNTGSVSYYSPGQPELLAVDSSIIKEVNPYKEQMDKTMNEIIGYSEQAMVKGLPESELGNFVADLCFETGVQKYKSTDNHGIDFCVLNTGGLRSSLPAGIITRRNVFELMPFENELVVLTLPGKIVDDLLHYISNKGGVPVSNLRMKISSGTYQDAFIGGQKFNESQVYKILTSDYLAFGGDGMDMFKEHIQSEPINCKVRDAIIDYIMVKQKRNEKIKSKTDGRISG